MSPLSLCLLSGPSAASHTARAGQVFLHGIGPVHVPQRDHEQIRGAALLPESPSRGKLLQLSALASYPGQNTCHIRLESLEDPISQKLCFAPLPCVSACLFHRWINFLSLSVDFIYARVINACTHVGIYVYRHWCDGPGAMVGTMA